MPHSRYHDPRGPLRRDPHGRRAVGAPGGGFGGRDHAGPGRRLLDGTRRRAIERGAPASRLRPRLLDRHKVTNAEFALFLNATGLRPPGSERRYDEDDEDARIHRVQGRWVADPGFERDPVVEVSWFGARDYGVWKGRRLPTEAEWQKAARRDDRR